MQSEPIPESASLEVKSDTPGTAAPRWRGIALLSVGTILCLFTLAEVNYPQLSPQSQLAIFAMLGMVLCFLHHPLHSSLKGHRVARASDLVLALLSVLACSYFVVQTEPAFASFWADGQSLGNRAGRENSLDFAVGGVLAILVLEATRRSIGLALPLLSLLFIGYCLYGQVLPSWLLPHRGYALDRTISQTVLQGQGIFGVALRVMFTYVFLFVIFGAFLKATGATGFIIDFAKKVFRNSLGGPAKVSVLSSGLMGSLSGSAVANTVTTGTFTIPMMRASGYSAARAAGIEAAASSGGALVPPVMGAAAYMMLEIVTPAVTYLQIVQAAILPAVLFYMSLFLIVHFHSKQLAAREGKLATVADFESDGKKTEKAAEFNIYAGLVFVGAFASLLGFLFFGYSPFRAVTLSLVVILILSCFHPSTRLNVRSLLEALRDSARDVIPLICAAACVGIVIGVVTLTGAGTRFPSLIIPIAEGSLLLALLVIMLSSIVLGMGLPSVVCYLLLATLIGDVLGDLGVVPLAGHMFIFYFGMLSMVTPPVALAAFAASSIAGAPMMATAMHAFRSSLVGFFLPFMFVFRPELLMLAPDGGPAAIGDITLAFIIAAIGTAAFAIGLTGYYFDAITKRGRILYFVAAGLLLFPGNTTLWEGLAFPIHDLGGAILFVVLSVINFRAGKRSALGSA
ncbi:MAG: TRAP transporter fused permease subunit [Verrucomicrobiales bacterium]|jgi:TRAP transporter 4TM/12TM fusion protein|nr:TRAP transporter fused permease subunit [Verrucomicrobiales bacterium]MDP5004324.1 TRAP transporter fused permease subunit [Verrucomicrobiales bacterium]